MIWLFVSLLVVVAVLYVLEKKIDTQLCGRCRKPVMLDKPHVSGPRGDVYHYGQCAIVGLGFKREPYA